MIDDDAWLGFGVIVLDGYWQGCCSWRRCCCHAGRAGWHDRCWSACPCYQHAQQPSLKVNLSVLKQLTRELFVVEFVWLNRLNSRIVLNLN